MEIDLCHEGREDRYGSRMVENTRREPDFHEAISFSPNYSLPTPVAATRRDRTCLDERVETVFLGSCAGSTVIGRDVGGSVQGSIDASWGGSGGTTIDYSLKAEGHDDKGNFAEASVHQNDKGEGGANVSAGHESKESSSDKGDKSK